MSRTINGNERCCGTCEYWSGPRRLNSISEVKTESSADAKCTRDNSYHSDSPVVVNIRNGHNCGNQSKNLHP